MNPAFSRFLLIAVTLLMATPRSHAVTYYWDGDGDTAGFAGATGTWASPTISRWTTTTGGTFIQYSITTTTSDDLYFGTDTVYMTTGTVTVSGTVNAKSMTFGGWGEGVTFTGGTINLGAAATITVNNAHNQSFGSTLTGAATSLTKSGGGIAILSGSNSYAGKTIVAGGILAITGAHSGTGEITLNGGILDLGNSSASGSLASTVLNVNGGEFRYTRNNSATQSFTTTNVNSTLATFVVNTGNTLNLGTVNRTLGTTPSLSYTGTGTLAALTASNVGGIMPGFHTVNSWVVANGAGIPITSLASGAYTSTSVAGTTASNYYSGNIDINNSPGTLAASITANTLRFSAAAANTLTLTGSNTVFAGGILVATTVGANLSSITGGSLTSAGGRDLHIIQSNTSGGLSIATNIVNDTGATTLTKSGNGLLTLSGANTFTGGLIINAGEVVLGSASALNSSVDSENAITFTTPTQGTLSLNGNSVTLGSLNGAFAAVNNFHTVQNNHSSNAATLTIGNGLNLNSNFEGLIQNGSAGATLALVKKGTGTLIIGGTVGNTYTGGTTIYGGTVVINNGAALGHDTCTLTFAGDSTLQPGYNVNPTLYQNIEINSGVTAKIDEINQFYSMSLNGVVSGSGTLWIGSTDNGQGSTTLYNASNTHTGTLRIGDGTKSCSLLVSSLTDGLGAIELGGTTGTGNLAIQGLGAITLDSRVIKLIGTTGGGTIRSGGGSSRVLTINTNLAVIGVGNKTLTLGGFNNVSKNNAFNGFIPDGVGSIISFTKEDYGKWILSKTANTYSGPTKIMDGVLEITKLSNGGVASSIGKSGSGPKNLIFGPGPGPGTSPVEGILRYIGTGDSTDRNFIMLGNATLDSSGSGPIVFGQTGIISPGFTGLVGTFYLGNPVVSGLASTADFMLGMAVTSDAFSGTKIITAITSSTITLDSGSGIQFGTFGFSVGYAANRILRLGGSQTGANTFSSILQDSPNHSNTSLPGVLNILKQDAGTWQLDGLNTYTGTTTISAGKLLINGNQSSATGNVTVAANATLGGTGTIGGNTTISASGKLEFNLSTAAASHNPLNLVAGKGLTFSGASTLTITSSIGASPGIYTLITGGNNITGVAPATLNLPVGWAATVSISGNRLLLNVTSTGIIIYSITYDGNGSTGGAVPVDVSSPYTIGAPVTVLGNTGSLARTGYTFNNWNTAADGSGTSYAPAATFNISTPTTLYAKWTANHYTVTFDGNLGSAPSPINKSVTYGSTYGTLATTTRTGYTFNGWFTAVSGGTQVTSGTAVNITAAQTLYAQWSVSTYAVTYNANAATSGTIPAAQTKTYAVSLTLPSNTGILARTGYTFAGWNTQADGLGTGYAAGGSYTANAPVTLYAKWTANTYTVTFDGNLGSAPSPISKSVTYGSTYGTLATTTRTSYTFKGWFTAVSGGTQVTSATAVSIAAAQTLYAQWTINTYAVTYNANAATSGTIPAAQTKTYAVSLTLQNNTGSLARTGYVFTGWNTQADGLGTGYAAAGSYTANAAVILFAKWTANSPPVATAKSVTTAEDTAKAITLVGTDADSSPLTYTIVSSPTHGALSGTAPNVTYTPTANYNGSDSLTFKVNDGTIDSAVATVSITVTAVKDAPLAKAKSVTTAEDTAKAITLIGTDVDLNSLTYTIVGSPVHGTLSGTAPNVTYKPTANYHGADSFTFKVNDGAVDSAVAKVSITVTSVNDAPVFITNPIVAAGTNEGVAYIGQTIAGKAKDVDAGSSITYSKVSGPAWLVVGSDGALSGTLPTGSAGLNSFVVRATDNASATTDATLKITVTVLPLPWVTTDIGTGILAGSASYSAGTFTQAGSGALASTADNFRFTYQTLSGDGEVIAKISALQNTGTSSRVGVMIRDSLASNSMMVFMGMSDTGTFRWARRTTTGGTVSFTTSSTGTVPNTWVRIIRSGTSIIAYKSINGTTWTLVGSLTGTFATTCYIGLVDCSGSKTTLNTSKFSNVIVKP